MALAKDTVHEQYISVNDEVCPYCGRPLRKRSETQQINTQRRGWLGRLWHGEVPLRIAFWFCFFIPAISINLIAITYPKVILGIVEWLCWLSYINNLGSVAILAVILPCLVYIAYLIICMVIILRSAEAYKGARKWAVFARIYVELFFVNSVSFIVRELLMPFLLIHR